MKKIYEKPNILTTNLELKEVICDSKLSVEDNDENNPGYTFDNFFKDLN